MAILDDEIRPGLWITSGLLFSIFVLPPACALVRTNGAVWADVLPILMTESVPLVIDANCHYH